MGTKLLAFMSWIVMSYGVIWWILDCGKVIDYELMNFGATLLNGLSWCLMWGVKFMFLSEIEWLVELLGNAIILWASGIESIFLLINVWRMGIRIESISLIWLNCDIGFRNWVYLSKILLVCLPYMSCLALVLLILGIESIFLISPYLAYSHKSLIMRLKFGRVSCLLWFI